MKDLLTYIAQNLVEHPQAVDVQETETDGNVVLELRVDPSMASAIFSTLYEEVFP